jgi:signal transduction histidine kinase
MTLARSSVRARLTLWHAGTLALVICVFAIGVFAFVSARLYRALDAQIGLDVASVERVYREEPGDLVELDHRIGLRLFEVTEGGTVLYRTEAWPPSGAASYRQRTLADASHRITVARDDASVRQALRTLAVILAVGVPAAVALAVAGGYVLAGRVLSPVGAMADTAHKITAESLAERLPVDNPDENLLTLTRAEGGRIIIAPRPADLDALAAGVADHLRVLAEEKEQSLTIEAGAHVTAVCDAAILRSGLVNLLHNAIKYTPPKGAIRVVIGRASSGEATIDVADTGPGIAVRHREHIFERFYRIDPGRSRDAGGVGLGLAIARWAVEANGGHLKLDSDEGRGSVFRIVLPSSPQS